MKRSFIAIITVVWFTGCVPTDTCPGEVVSSQVYENGEITEVKTCVTDTVEYEMK